MTGLACSISFDREGDWELGTEAEGSEAVEGREGKRGRLDCVWG